MSIVKVIVALAMVSFAQIVAADEPPVAVGAASPTSLDAVIAKQMEESGVVGIGAAIIVNRSVVWSKGYGLADNQTGAPFTTDTIMNVGSIAKTVTGVAMMLAVQEGKIDLDKDINAYLPFQVRNPHHPDAKITLRHLATHTSSITDRWAVYARTYHYGKDSPEPLGTFLETYFKPDGSNYAAENFLDARPGEVREYSNIGAALAGLIVERAYGEPLPVLTRRVVFSPLQMHRTGWLMSDVDLASHSRLYVVQNGFVIPIPLYGGTTYPDGGLRTSVADLSTFFVMLLNGGEHGGTRILDAEIAAEMTRFQFTDANRPKNFPATSGNSGLFWRTKFGGTRVGHGGSDPGIQTEMLADLSGEIGVVMLVNTSLSGDEQRATAAIFDALWEQAAAWREGKSPMPAQK
jgi:CubicO group peptidase (beta-lactamase class C family)